eukprot:9498258-Lingulodinium_polyedra.AAC.1
MRCGGRGSKDGLCLRALGPARLGRGLGSCAGDAVSRGPTMRWRARTICRTRAFSQRSSLWQPSREP